MSIVCLGEAIVDLVCERELDSPADADRFTPHPGGALANVAVAVARARADAALIGGVGDDPWGAWLRTRLEGEGVDTRWLATVPGLPTPVAFVTFDRRREPTFSIYGEGIGPTMAAGGDSLDEALPRADALIFGSNTLVGDRERDVTARAVRRARQLRVPVLFDPNIRPTRWDELERAVELCREMSAGCLVVRANQEEAERITGHADPESAALTLCELGAELGVVTLGPDGAVMRGATEAAGRPPDVEVVAPMGAGDAFMGALAAGLGRVGFEAGRGAEALPSALAAGAAACAGWGAQG
jgi:sugar/nucleoside kinase (ribokinase family)